VDERTGRKAFRAQPQFIEDLSHWVDTDVRVAAKVLELVKDALRDPFHGLGKPEPLKGAFAGCWSRRITQEHRLVYRVVGGEVDFLQCRYHYQ
jgi:toxin YoeB